MFEKILIANRGEIAVRIIRACKELGIKTVAIYSDVDKYSLHVQMADESYCIGPASIAKSYLNIPNIISAALISEAEAIHPGYGFLAENPSFVEICESHHIKFIGPSKEAMNLMGDKTVARETVRKMGVPVIPGSQAVANEKEAEEIARSIGYPVIIKAAAGGGGKGMRLADNKGELLKLLPTAQMEATASFGDERVYLEKFLIEPRHVEVQILADAHGNCIYLGERDCSIQRRHQKLVEEAPSPAVGTELRKKIGEMALKAAKTCGYTSAGTVEFLLDKDKKYYFIEMNTRIQVEHPVTEMITGLDLIKVQIQIAAGEKLKVNQRDIAISGHSIECRINAEDPESFAPSTGTIETLILPGGPGIRIDTHIFTGYQISPYYDSLLAKLIVWGHTRKESLERMYRALEEFKIHGIKTNIPFHKKLLLHPSFKEGKVHTQFTEQFLANKEIVLA